MPQLNSGCGCFVAQGLPDESCFWGWFVLLSRISVTLLDFEFGYFIVHRLSAVPRFRI